MIYDGHNYAENWLKEAEGGASVYKTTVESLEVFLKKETEELPKEIWGFYERGASLSL